MTSDLQERIDTAVSYFDSLTEDRGGNIERSNKITDEIIDNLVLRIGKPQSEEKRLEACAELITLVCCAAEMFGIPTEDIPHDSFLDLAWVSVRRRMEMIIEDRINRMNDGLD